jgi:VIT1/CCC1 family predicted Fe2+/Mn2+ transporter
MLGKPAPSLLDPIDRISEVLFGLIMVLTSTSTLSVATAGRAEVGKGEADSLRQKLLLLAEPPAHPGLTKDDALRAAAICLWVFASTFPVVVPFLFIGEVQPALRLSNAIAIAMLFVCGYAFARCTGLRPWPTGLLMVAIGCAMVGVAVMLGG